MFFQSVPRASIAGSFPTFPLPQGTPSGTLQLTRMSYWQDNSGSEWQALHSFSYVKPKCIYVGNYTNNYHKIRKKVYGKEKNIDWKENRQGMEYKTSNVKVEIEILDM